MYRNNLWVVPIEPIETRYTKHWYKYVPEQLRENINNFDVRHIEVKLLDSKNTPGAFFNFADTMIYKSRQAEYIASLFSNDEIKNGDVFLFMDYWNPTAHNIKYMASLLNISVKVVGICHAGMWDPADILGRSFNPIWGKDIEKSFDSLYDTLVFATNFSKDLYEKSYGQSTKNIVTGFPMEYYNKVMEPYWNLKIPKENIIVFPHRKSPEKHLKLFEHLATLLPEYRFVVAMDECSNKEEYHNLLYRSKVCFSASLQETLGISVGIEALIAGCNVMVPNRLSYKEMFGDEFKYSENIASTYEYDENDVVELVQIIKDRFNNYNMESIRKQYDFNKSNFFDGRKFYEFVDSMKGINDDMQ